MADKTTRDHVRQLMKHPKCIRNICILAHVDHGKTTVADCLLTTIQCVSKRLAGTLRYLDDRLDEQARKITMKSSAVSLVDVIYGGENKPQQIVLMNMIDTPGHIDFSTEVTAAVKVSDGAIILVDVVEGVCVQTRESIKQAFEQKAKMILLLNKLDKLFVNKDVHQTFLKISQIIEDCNSTVAQLYQYTESEVDIENTGLLFQPEKGNVIFASAVHGWGFTLKHIAEMFTSMLPNESVESLNEKLWDFDLYIDSNSKTIKKGAILKGKTNVFTQLCLKTLKYVYETILVKMDRDKVDVILKKLGIENVTRDMKHKDAKIQIKSILETWKPLASTIFKQCYDVVPAPNAISLEKIEYLLDKNFLCEDPCLIECTKELISHFEKCSSDDEAPVVLYVSKMFCVDKSNIEKTSEELSIVKKNEVNKEEGEEEKDTVTVALARVFSGNLKKGQEVYVLHQGYKPDLDKIEENLDNFIETNTKITKTTVKELYMVFGRELKLADNIPAGNICAIGGLESSVLRTATVSNTPKCIPLVEQQPLEPVVRNIIEPMKLRDLPVLRKGLKELMQSDSCVQVLTQETGDLVLLTSGSVHLEKCLEDLKTKFAKIDFEVSSPMVSLRETIIDDGSDDCDESNVVTLTAGNFTVSVVAVSIPTYISEFITKNYDLLKMIEEHTAQDDGGGEEVADKVFKSEMMNMAVSKLKENLRTVFSTEKNIWANLHDKIWSVGASKESVNLLINDVPDYPCDLFNKASKNDIRRNYDFCITNPFKYSCKYGPLCEERLMNCAFIVKQFQFDKNLPDDSKVDRMNLSIVQKQFNTLFKKAVQKRTLRLMEPMFTTEIQVNTSILGSVYQVVEKRNGKVLDAVCMDEEEKKFVAKAQLPVIDSEGFANEILKMTSGQALPTLKFSHFEIIDGDPFYVPDGDEEVDKMAARANAIMKKARKKKGLHVDDQVVEHAEKERNVNKKK